MNSLPGSRRIKFFGPFGKGGRKGETIPELVAAGFLHSGLRHKAFSGTSKDHILVEPDPAGGPLFSKSTMGFSGWRTGAIGKAKTMVPFSGKRGNWPSVGGVTAQIRGRVCCPVSSTSSQVITRPPENVNAIKSYSKAVARRSGSGVLTSAIPGSRIDPFHAVVRACSSFKRAISALADPSSAVSPASWALSEPEHPARGRESTITHT